MGLIPRSLIATLLVSAYTFSSAPAYSSEQDKCGQNTQDASQAIPSIFSPEGAKRLEAQQNTYSSDKSLERVIEYQSPQKEILRVEPLAPQFDSKGDVFKHTLSSALPYNSLLAIEAQHNFGNMNGSPDKRLGASIGFGGGTGNVKIRYALLPDLISVETSLTASGNVQARIPLAPLLHTCLSKDTKISGAIMYDIHSNKPEQQHLFAGAYMRW